MTEAAQVRTRMNALVPEPPTPKCCERSAREVTRRGSSFSLLHVQAGFDPLNQSNTYVWRMRMLLKA